MTNSRAPPAVRPPPTKPASSRLIGLASPLSGVGNLITEKESAGLIVSRSAICFAFKPAISSAAVTKTSLFPGGPSVGNDPLPGITLARVSGMGFVTAASRAARIARPAPPGIPGVAIAATSPTMPTASTAADPQLPLAMFSPKLAVPKATLGTPSTTSSAHRPSGSTYLYGLLLAYAYRLKLWGFWGSNPAGSMARKRPIRGSYQRAPKFWIPRSGSSNLPV